MVILSFLLVVTAAVKTMWTLCNNTLCCDDLFNVNVFVRKYHNLVVTKNCWVFKLFWIVIYVCIIVLFPRFFYIWCIPWKLHICNHSQQKVQNQCIYLKCMNSFYILQCLNHLKRMWPSKSMENHRKFMKLMKQWSSIVRFIICVIRNFVIPWMKICSMNI